jgi:hypothetical protein
MLDASSFKPPAATWFSTPDWHKYWPGDDSSKALHGFFEDLLPYTLSENPRHTQDTSADHFAFIIYELFIYAAATLLKERRFHAVDDLLSDGYYLSEENVGVRYEAGLRSFNKFRPYLRSIEDQEDHNRISRTSDFLDDRANRDDIRLKDIMQAELILYLRSEVDQTRTEDRLRSPWHPYSLLRACNRHHPFELFARAAESGSFDGLDSVMNLENWSQLQDLLATITENGRFRPFNHRGVPIYQLVGLTRP